MELSTILNERHSARWFKEDQIDRSKIEAIVKAAQHAPSWINSQTPKAVVAMGTTLKQIRAEHASLNHDEQTPSAPYLPYKPVPEWDARSQKNMKGWFASRAAVLGDDWSAKLGQAGDALYNAQAVVYFILPKDFSQWSLIDLGSFMENMILAAHDEGLASIPAYQYVLYPDHLAKHLGLADDEVAVMGLGLGYRDDQAAVNESQSTRAATDEILRILD
ncbi:nitroreductase [Leuconostocaceae bacterium ESL0958]|nr:nitroreductase [Leuconostocaceae bacterium ESL0958]